MQRASPETGNALCTLGSGRPYQGGGSHFRSFKGESKLMSHMEEFAIQYPWEVKYKWSHLLRIWRGLRKDSPVKMEADTSQGMPGIARNHQKPGQGMEQTPLTASQKDQLCQHFHFKLLASRRWSFSNALNEELDFEKSISGTISVRAGYTQDCEIGRNLSHLYSLIFSTHISPM